MMVGTFNQVFSKHFTLLATLTEAHIRCFAHYQCSFLILVTIPPNLELLLFAFR